MRKQPGYFKLGLFVLVSLAIALVGAVALGARVSEQPTVPYHVFFDESVQGLDVGAPVKYRGVNVGVVARIDIAPDRRHVDVVCELDVESLRRMGLSEETYGDHVEFPVPEGLRAQLGMQGITGVKFVLIDFFDPAANPPPPLPFSTPPNTIPAARSLMKNVEETVPKIGEELLTILERVDRMVATLEEQQVPEKVAALVVEITDAVRDARKVIAAIDRERIPARLAKTLQNAESAFAGLDATMQGINAEDGLVASAKRATDSFGDFGQSATTGTRDMADALQDVSEAAQAVRRLADALERDPDMLLKGRAEGERK